MSNIPRDPSYQSLPQVKPHRRSESASSIYESKKPTPTLGPKPTNTSPLGGGGTSSGPGQRPQSIIGTVHHRFLTPAEWARVAHGIGAIREGENHNVVHPICWYWPPKGMPEGLYRDVVFQRTKYFIKYQLLSTMRWILMIFQIILGAILTALGSVSPHHSIPITVLAAINTIDAGLLALMHNSGLPDRYRLNKVEFTRVEDFLKEILDTGVVETGQTVDDVLSDCFARFQTAKNTVLINMPDSYTMSPHPTREKSMVLCPDPPIHFMMGHP
ncbi:hypothetical protein V8F20_005555 [Naviculisporaceae sp. PSN 640]